MKQVRSRRALWLHGPQRKGALALVALALSSLLFWCVDRALLKRQISMFFIVPDNAHVPFHVSRRLSSLEPAPAAELDATPVQFWPRKGALQEGSSRYPHTIKRMCIIGERNSGTNWLAETLNLNFQGGQPRRFGIADSACYRHKHWFHFPGGIEPLIADEDLVFVIFRNAADWLLHFSTTPHHSHNHAYIPFEEFLSKPWVPGTRTDACAFETRTDSLSETYYEDYREQFGGPYGKGPIRDVLQLRAMKIDNFLRIRDWVPNGHQRVIYVRYEDLLEQSGEGMRLLVDELKANFDIAGLCQGTKSQPSVVSHAYKADQRQRVSLGVLERQQVYNRNINATKFLSSMARRNFFEGADLDMESRIGYTYDYLPRPISVSF